ncbi:MAG TPA: phenylalanine--tRNA ligase subunit beta, partial [Bacilli bacterium]|nr:phenylalanine--tRNA ligase subunit beta [Bacilli bacterium]
VGAVLPAGEIKATTIRGVESNGMICSLAELGLESKYVKESDKLGIHILDDSAPVGVDALEYLGFDDSYVDYELTANRSDLLSMIGMAYEVGAIYNEKVNYPEINLKEVEEKNNVKIESDTPNCRAYLSRIVKNIVIKESPDFIKSRLMCAGIRPINNVVDISNYVMLEYGQPLHFFDYDKLGNKVIIRQAKNKETIVTLDKIERKLKESDIVICDEKHPVALAGVMGGLDTEITIDTKNILIESAIFNPYNIRYTSKEILRSEASIRFEKGINPSATLEALNRAAYLLQEYASGEVLTGIEGFNNQSLDDKNISITSEKINKILGMDISISDMKGIFTKLGFVVEESEGNFNVSVPARRLDINIEEDLIEEIGRMYGYSNMEGVLPVSVTKKGSILPIHKYIKDIKNRLYSLGLNETVTYSLVGKNEINMFTNDEFKPIITSAPLNEDRSIMRYSLLPSLLIVANYNLSRNIKDINIFEISKVYYDEDKETYKLGILMEVNYISNSWKENITTDFYVIKGVLENLFGYLGILNRYKLDIENITKDYHPSMSASILVDNESVGTIGKVHPSVTKDNIYVLELDINKLFDIHIKKPKFKEIPKYPSITKDVAFIIDNNINSKSIEEAISKKGGKIVTNVEVFDLFKNIEPDKKSLAFKITFSDISKTLTEEEVNLVLNNIIESVEKEFNAILRNK